MERNSQILTELVNDYRLELNGVKFWTPYWANAAEAPFHLGAPYSGKGTPGQLRRALTEKLAKSKEKPTTAEAYRKLMRSFGLGVECSGFAYYLLDHWLRRHGLKLADHVFVPKAEVIAASGRPRWQAAGVSQAQLAGLPEFISITKLHDLFKVNPRYNINVDRLTSAKSSRKVDIDDTKPGDLIKMSGFKQAHVGVVVKATTKKLTYVDSSREWGNYGGVRFVEINLSGSSRQLEDKTWVDRKYFFPEKGDSLRRLRVLDGRE